MNKITEEDNMKSFQDYLEEIYGPINKDLNLEYIYGYLCRTSGYLFKSVATGDINELHLIRPISWLFAFASKIEVDVQTSFISRFPECCPYCVQETCICFKTSKNPPKYIPAYRVKQELDRKYSVIKNSSENITLDYAKDIIAKIYPNNEIIWRYAGPWHHFAKLQEEIAELHEAMSGFIKGKKPLSSVQQEISDILAWLLGIWHIKINKPLSSEFISYYFSGCPVCNNKPCTCKSYDSRPTGLIDIDVLMDIKKNLEELYNEIPNKQKNEIRDLIKSITVASNTQDETTSSLSIHQTREKMENFKNIFSKMSDFGQRALPTIDTILSIIGNLKNMTSGS